VGPTTPLGIRHVWLLFPVPALPGWVGEQVVTVAEFTQTPPDLADCIALAVLSAAAGGHAMVEIRPGWCEPVNLFTVVAMPPSSRKSAVFAAMTAPPLEAMRGTCPAR
jgi:replicative DNA helicase